MSEMLSHKPSAPSVKGVTIYDEPQHMEPIENSHDSASSSFPSQAPRVHRTSISSRKMTGRPAISHNASTASLTRQFSNVRLDSPDVNQQLSLDSVDQNGLLHQVMQWLAEEKSKRAMVHPKSPSNYHKQADGSSTTTQDDQDLDLDKLEKILARYVTEATRSARRQSTTGTRRASIAKRLMPTHSGGAQTSDTDAGDAVALVPHVEAVLDNTKTLAFTGGAKNDDPTDVKSKEEKNWHLFKQEILRLTHTLKLRGWRRLALQNASLIHVERLSGALTNAVYVVKAPKDLDLYKEKDAEGNLVPARRLPKDLLLRIYGPQVEHLIDRDAELLILRRLAAKNIGPKLLGYFSNGRFEEFLHARTLKYEDLRNPSISKQIAKRMKELHEGIELLQKEREDGPFVFLNWDKWVSRVEKVITWLDQQVHNDEKGKSPASIRYTRRGLICGVEWKTFRATYERYRKLLIKESGGSAHIHRGLVFAHNDTQYGNLMRLQPPEESPLLHAINEHKQLVVIDFEYANANLPGVEFANHFTEWCYNYHDEERSYACNTKAYPTLEEQHRFIRAYVMHRPQYSPSASSTPMMDAREKTNIPDFMLDARTPSGYSIDYEAEEKAREKDQEAEIQRLLRQTRMWRIANHAQWVAWGIVQAKVPELDEPPRRHLRTVMLEKLKDKLYGKAKIAPQEVEGSTEMSTQEETINDTARDPADQLHAQSDPLDAEVREKQEEARSDRPEGRDQEEAHKEGEDDEEESFDYLAYAQERAMFFWGDCIQMGIVKEEELPKAMRSQIKYVKY